MRKIKFRSWDKKLKVMAYSTDTNQEHGWFTDNNGCMICVRIEEEKDIKLNNIMQYTGLKDSTGKEIYEGDLVEHEMETDGEWDEYEACEIVFDETCGVYCFKNDAPNLLTDYRKLKVIGNIYENQELLRQ